MSRVRLLFTKASMESMSVLYQGYEAAAVIYSGVLCCSRFYTTNPQRRIPVVWKTETNDAQTRLQHAQTGGHPGKYPNWDSDFFIS